MKTIIQTATGDVTRSLKFYATLDFEIISIADKNFVADGEVLIEINQERNARPGIKLIKPDWNQEVHRLKELTTVIEIENGFIANDPSGTWIYLIEADTDSYPTMNNNTESKLGDFAGISIESIAFGTSIKVWQLLGFKTTMGGEDQGWVSLKNEDNFSVSIMKANACPHLFFNPSLTYFNGDKNLAIIEKIKNSNITIAEEITSFNEQGIVDNIVLQDPGGLGCFVFSD